MVPVRPKRLHSLQLPAQGVAATMCVRSGTIRSAAPAAEYDSASSQDVLLTV